MDKPYQKEHERAIRIEALIKDMAAKRLAQYERGILTTNEFIWYMQEIQAEAINTVDSDI